MGHISSNCFALLTILIKIGQSFSITQEIKDFLLRPHLVGRGTIYSNGFLLVHSILADRYIYQYE